jgi:hypothetical protein
VHARESERLCRGAHPCADAARCGAALQIEVLQELKKGDPERRWRVRFALGVAAGTPKGAKLTRALLLLQALRAAAAAL